MDADSSKLKFDGMSARWGNMCLISKGIHNPCTFCSLLACAWICALFQYWTDIYLSWNPETYPGVQNLRFPSSLLWMPDILLYNRFDTSYFPFSIHFVHFLRRFGCVGVRCQVISCGFMLFFLSEMGLRAHPGALLNSGKIFPTNQLMPMYGFIYREVYWKYTKNCHKCIVYRSCMSFTKRL